MTRNYRYKTTPSIHDSRLGPYDILCGRTSHAYNNVGNRRFRVTLRMYLLRYQRLRSRADRKIFIFYLTRLFREEIGFRFLKQEAGDFHDIGEVETRKKIGHALLDQTVKHPIHKVATAKTTATATSTTTVVSSCSPPALLRKVTADVKKRPLRSILKTPSQSLKQSQQLLESSSSSNTNQKVRRVSLPLAAEASPFKGILLKPNHHCCIEENDVSTNSKAAQTIRPAPSFQTKERVTKLESEICMLLVGMNKQIGGGLPSQQKCAA